MTWPLLDGHDDITPPTSLLFDSSRGPRSCGFPFLSSLTTYDDDGDGWVLETLSATVIAGAWKFLWLLQGQHLSHGEQCTTPGKRGMVL